MSLTLTPQNKNYGDANTTPDIKVQVEESDNLEIRGNARIIDGSNNTVKTEHFESKGKYTYSPNLETVWENMEDGASSVQLTVTSYEQIPESPINGSSLYLHLDKNSYSYNGSVQSPTIIGYDSSKMTFGGTVSARDVGTYVITVTPKEGYYWTGQPQGVDKYGAISFTWNIVKADGYVRIDGITVRNNGTANIYLYSYNKQKEISFVSPMYTTFKENGRYTPINMIFVTGGSNYLLVTPYSNGTTYVDYVASGSNGYDDISFRINFISDVLQTINALPYQIGDIYYDGYRQWPTWGNYDSNKIKVSGGDQHAIDPGTYYIYFEPNSGYQWWDGTTTGKAVQWEIKSAYTPPIETTIEISIDPTPIQDNSFNFTLSTSAVSVKAGRSVSITVYPTGEDGTGKYISCNSDNTSIATANQYSWQTQHHVLTEGNNNPLIVYVRGEHSGTTTIPFSYYPYSYSYEGVITRTLTVTVT